MAESSSSSLKLLMKSPGWNPCRIRTNFYDFTRVKSGVDKKPVTFCKRAYIHPKFNATQERVYRGFGITELPLLNNTEYMF